MSDRSQATKEVVAAAEYAGKSYRCLCYFTNNIFLKDYNIHVTYASDQQFWKDYGQALHQRGCTSQTKRQDVMKKIQNEVKRRRNTGKESVHRREVIKRLYRPLNPDIYALQESFLDPVFLELVSYCKQREATPEGLITRLTSDAGEGVYSFPVFTVQFCHLFVELLKDFENSSCPKGRPNTMNEYGVLLDELGLDEDFLTPLRENYLQPISKLLYPDCGGGGLDSHKAFIVQYKLSQDLDLSYHYDNAEVTLNVSLGTDFVGGNLYFGTMRGVKTDTVTMSECVHTPGRGVFHRGQQRHGAYPITSGERYNLIIWMRCSRVRNELCPMCDLPPDLVEVEGPGDGFTETLEEGDHQDTVSVCQVT